MPGNSKFFNLLVPTSDNFVLNFDTIITSDNKFIEKKE